MRRSYGRSRPNFKRGTRDNDEIFGSSKKDIIFGLKGDDDLYGEGGNDWIFGGKGDDNISGGEGKDFLFGQKGNDNIDGGNGNDWLRGGKGDDTLKGGEGNDHLNGGKGMDTALFTGNFADYKIKESGRGCNNKIIVHDKVGADGKDTLKSIEKLVFADGTYENGVFTPFNRAPIVVKDSAVVDEDSSVIMNVLANDSDPDGDPLSVILVVNVFHGTAVINPDNTITYTPDPDFHGTESIVYTIQDPDGATAVGRINILINPVDDPVEPNLDPVLRKDGVTIQEDETVTINALQNDIDPNGDPLTITSVQGLDDGVTVVNADNTITFTPDANFNGEESFLYNVTDGNGGHAIQRINVTINPVTDVYEFTNDDFVTPRVIENFDIDITGDILDITDIISGYDSLTDSITEFVQLTDNGSDTIISVDSDGGADNFVQIATLTDINGLDEITLETNGNIITA